MVGWLKNFELERNVEESGRGQLERHTGIRLQGLRKTTEKNS
jgi:hypothetical protein